MNVLFLILSWMFLIVLGVPVGVSLLIVCVGFFQIMGYGLAFTVERMVGSLNSFPMLAVPLFILTATLLNTSGITQKMFRFAKSLVCHIPGGLGHVNVLTSLFFAGMSGSAIADSGGLGKIEIQAMREAGYEDAFSGSITSASSIIGPLIPPSIPMVIYGVVANESIGQLFLGGILPGLLCTLALMVMIYVTAKKVNYPVSKRSSIKEVIVYFKESFWALLTPFIIIVGIFGGFFSPTEAAAITTLYALLLGFFVYRDLSITDFLKAIYETAVSSAAIGVLIMGVGAFGYIVTREQVSQRLTEYILSLIDSPWLFILAVNVILFILGSFIESLVILLVLIPVLTPIAASYGISGVHFGIVVILNLMISTLTPPMGVSLFVVAKVSNIPFEVLAKAIWRWLVPLITVLLLVSYVPFLSTYLPSLIIE